MLSRLRDQARAQLAAVPAWRKPALRRTDAPDALMMTDLPRAAAPAEVNAFCRRMETSGWRIRRIEGWLLMDHDVPPPSCSDPMDPRGEAGCCLSLLLRHPSSLAPAESIRALAKAQETGPAAVERLCRQWHGQWAQRLREHRPLPGGLTPYLRAAMACTQDTPDTEG